MRKLSHRFAFVAAAALLAACSTYELDKSPPFYENLARPGAEVNVAAAASMFSDYRRANGLPAVQVDPTLLEVARDQARRMAAANQLTHDPGGRGFTQRLTSANYQAARAAENIGAGYHTLAEAFSGWRDSPSHNKNMLLPGATRLGIATAYASNSKYRVFWALVLAEPAESR
ncbi:MAG: CAP domain-containing protein [Xanthobacteraceae bacterium]